MKSLGHEESEAVADVRCHVCSESTRLANDSLQYGRLEAHWGYGTAHDGEHYEVHLCERCFFTTLAYLKQERRTAHLFDIEPNTIEDELGLVSRDD
ncbi:hypothetical protein G7017_08015 [Pseudomonas fulva]|uniref:hypothetical protein n=1 Tax=Pseudomonas fulva TaxID=47880 RepID=UPI0015E3F6A1|nr:hypothetical protein [Pseudomonas fulva]MBA1220842.1 hypothetical protein [Pseudomonas fulva]MBN4168141.1 hypothetical protein [Pseudomonas fulva]